jgi:hypothetical protein
MNVIHAVVTQMTTVATPAADLRGALDLNDNGHLGWPDALGWLLFATVGLLGVGVVTGMAFAGVTAVAHGLGRIGRTALSPTRRHGRRAPWRASRSESASVPAGGARTR